MQKPISPIVTLLLASVLVLVPSCGDPVPPAPLPPPPADIAADQKNDLRPAYSAAAATSEDAHEEWVDDALDWGDRRDLLAYRWCQLWNKFASAKTDCGKDPSVR